MKKNTSRPERNDLLANAFALGVRLYRESDLHKLEELYRQNFPHLDEGRL